MRTPEYVEYVLRQQNLTVDELMNNLRTEFKEYKAFREFLRSNEMKCRENFISNSSSSSFILIGVESSRKNMN